MNEMNPQEKRIIDLLIMADISPELLTDKEKEEIDFINAKKNIFTDQLKHFLN